MQDRSKRGVGELIHVKAARFYESLGNALLLPPSRDGRP